LKGQVNRLLVIENREIFLVLSASQQGHLSLVRELERLLFDEVERLYFPKHLEELFELYFVWRAKEVDSRLLKNSMILFETTNPIQVSLK
jgi:hypothetical protein